MSAEDQSLLKRFEALYAETEELRGLIKQSDGFMREPLEVIKSENEAVLAELAQTPEISNHYRALGETATRRTQEFEAAAPILERHGRTDLIEAKRQELDAYLKGLKEGATFYYLSEFGGGELVLGPAPEAPADPVVPAEKPTGSAPAQPAPPDEAPVPSKPEGKPASAPPTPEVKQEKLPLGITIGSNFNVILNDRNERPRTLGRKLKGLPHHETLTEYEVRQLRADVLKFFEERPDEEFKASEILAVIRPGQEYNSSNWNNTVGDFLKDKFKSKGKPVITVTEVHSRLKTYSSRNFDLKVEKAKRPIRVKYGETVFILPDGEVVSAGDAASVAHLCYYYGSERNPINAKHVFGKGKIIEPGALEDEPTQTMGQFASQIRSMLSGIDYLEFVRVNRSEDPEGKGVAKGYYIKDLRVEAQGKLEDLFSLEEAVILSSYLDLRGNILHKNGLPIIPANIAMSIRDQARDHLNSGPKTTEELEQLRHSALQKALDLLNDIDKLGEAIDGFGKTNDPRLGLLEYLMDCSDEASLRTMRRFIERQVGTEVTWYKSSSSHSRGYDMVDIVHRSLENEETGVSDDKSEQREPDSEDDQLVLSPETPPAAAKSEEAPQAAEEERAKDTATPPVDIPKSPRRRPERKRSSKREREPARLGKLRRRTREEIARLEQADLFKPGAVRRSTIHAIGNAKLSGILGTEEMMRRAVDRGIVTRVQATDKDASFPIETFVAMAVSNSNPQVFEERVHRQRALDIVKEEVDKRLAEIRREEAAKARAAQQSSQHPSGK